MLPIVRRLRQIRCFLLDMDGTFYLGDRLLPGALEFIQYLEEQGLSYLFLTNNSSRSRREYAAKLARLGLELPEDRIFTSGEATAIYLRKQKPGARLFVVGTPALEDEFIRFGFQLVDQNPDYLVLGFDTSLTYAKIVRLSDFLVAGIPYIATHPDINCPTETGFIPDIGSMIEMMAASTGRRPDVIVGKPNLPIVQSLVEKTGIPVQQTCMVGDRLYTDIALGQTGLATVLVMSGETRPEDLPLSRFKPDLTVQDLAGLLQLLSGEAAA